MSIDLPVVAGAVSTTIFTLSMLPMLVKAVRTKDLRSYSGGNLALINLANLVHSAYVYNLPVGPIWVLHTCYLVSAALMLVWYVRFARADRARSPATDETAPTHPGDHGPSELLLAVSDRTAA